MLPILPLDLYRWKRINWWLCFAGAYSLIYCFSLVLIVWTQPPCTALEGVQTVMNGIGIVAVWGLGLRRQIFRRTDWMVFFVADISIFLMTLIIPGSPTPAIPLIALIFLAAALCLPYYVGMFLYAFRSEAIWQTERATEDET